MVSRNTARTILFSTAVVLGAAGCVTLGEIGSGQLRGHVVVEWYKEDLFIYRQQKANPFSFKPSFLHEPITPKDMYTDGGSIPRVFWGIPGLSPWGLGPAYIIHDWIFEVHRCKWPELVEVQNISFKQSAQILAEVGKDLIDKGLIAHDLLPQITWAVQTRYAQTLWDQPPGPDDCKHPKPIADEMKLLGLTTAPKKVVDFEIP